jgi:hypothetical protein
VNADRLPAAEQRRRVAQMKSALAAARLARDDAWGAVAATEQRLGAARVELATIERRRDLARGIDDTETVAVADRFAAAQRESIALLERKLAVQRDEAAFAGRTAEEMESELRLATGRPADPASGAPPHVTHDGAPAGQDAPAAPGDGAPSVEVDERDFGVLDHARRAREAAERLAALKRRMGRDA